MRRYEVILNERYKLPVMAAAMAVVAVLLIADIEIGRAGGRVNIPILYVVPLLASAWVRDRRFLWSFAAAMVVCAFVPLLTGAISGDPALLGWRILSRAMAAIVVLTAAAILHVMIRIWNVAMRQRDELVEEHRRLEESHEELAAREEEISRQNEELQSQTEELERHGEALRESNDQLGRREKMLESLLQLARKLSSELSSQETMQAVCDALGQLVNGSGLASAVLEKQGDDLAVRCHDGFGQAGPTQDRIPYARSFASLVIERGQTGYLEDVSLRPDLELPQPQFGARHVSVLAAPVRVGYRTVGSLEIYSPERRNWTEEQIALIESLAAQVSISLSTAALFEDVENQRRRLASVLQTVPVGIAMTGADMRDITLNRAGAAILDVAPGTILGPIGTNKITMFRDGVPVPLEQSPLARAARDRQEIRAEEYELLLPGRKRITVLIGASPIIAGGTSDGRVDGAVASFVDITAQKDHQRELDARRREAEELSVRKTRFLAAVSHDIRTPANAIGLLGELLQRSANNPTLASEVPELARDLNRSAVSLVNLVSDVLDMTRMDTGKVELIESEFDLGTILADECRQLTPLADQKKIAFTCRVPDSSIRVRTDSIKLARVLSNLIGNAIKFTQKGKVEVSASRTEDGGVRISVADTGPGIAREHVHLIFDEFFQLRNPDRDSSKGSGLGLTISKRLVAAMGGTIAVESKLGDGSTFTLTLPASAVVAYQTA